MSYPKRNERTFPANQPGLLAPDLSPEVQELLVEKLRQMSAAEKLQILASLTRSTWQLSVAEARRQYPAASEQDCVRKVGSRMVGAELISAFEKARKKRGSDAA